MRGLCHSYSNECADFHNVQIIFTIAQEILPIPIDVSPSASILTEVRRGVMRRLTHGRTGRDGFGGSEVQSNPEPQKELHDGESQ